MSIRRSLILSHVLVLLCTVVAMKVAAQPRSEAFGDVDTTFPLATMHRPFIQDASAVVRLDVRRFVVESEREATEHVRRVVTVLKPAGKEHARVALPHDKFRHIDRLEGRIRDVRGNVVRTLRNDDQHDFSAISGMSLYEQNRVRTAELYHSTYPYTAEFAYTIEHDGLIGWPTWRARARAVPVERTAFEIDAPSAIPIRYVVKHGSWAPEKGKANGRHWVRWSTTELEQNAGEPYGPPWREQVTTVHTAPTGFEIEGAAGRMDNWAAFGRWYHRLTRGRSALPAATAREVQTLAAAAEDTVAIVDALYRFMQDRTRYVSVQLGIGSWQPFPASYVEERGYGDCKALTNYMQALLDAAGIPSYQVLIRAGRNAAPVLADFPSNQFNHVVLAVPVGGDTLWLENTDQTAPFGHVSASIEDRYGLLVSPEGGKLIRTPRSMSTDNLQQRRASVQLAANGNARAAIRTTYTGNQQDRVRHALVQKSSRARREWLRGMIGIPNFSVAATDFSDADARRRTIELPIELTLPRYGARTGRRMFFRPNLMQQTMHVPPARDGLRTEPIHFGAYPFTDTDSITYVLPEGFDVEAAPAPVRLETPFGSYEMRVDTPSDSSLVYRRRLEVRQVTLAPDQYDAFRTFLRDVAEADRQQVVLVERRR